MLDLTTPLAIAARDPQTFALANCLRALAIDAVNAADSGHPGAPMGMADAATVLFQRHLKFDASAPDWPDRDRFVLSNGHASMLLYGLLHVAGYEDMTIEQIRNFRQWGAITAGHPEWGHAKGWRRRPARWGRASPPPSAWRWPNARWRRSSPGWWITGHG